MDLENTPIEITPVSSPSGEKRGRRRKAAPKPGFDSAEKLAMAPVGTDKASFMRAYYQRRRILTVPKEILDANPDKHFIYVNMPRLEQSGFWHNQGYRLFKTNVDSENQVNARFDAAIDNYVHRNEMVLAWIPKEEYEARQIEFDIARGRRDVTEKISKNPNLSGFHPHAKEEKQRLRFPEERKT